MEVPANQWRKLWRFDVYKVNKDVWRELIIAHALNRQDESQVYTENPEAQITTEPVEPEVHIYTEPREQEKQQPVETKEEALQRIMRGDPE